MGFQLAIKTDLSKVPAIVETNIDEVQPIIAAAIERTKGLEVTDNKDEIVAADEDASKLTKMKQAISRFRIDQMAAWAKPMSDFEAKCKKAEKDLEEAATAIKTKTGEVKELWRSRKREKCAKLWAEKIAEAFPNEADADIVVAATKDDAQFFAFWTNPKTKGTWLNSSVKLETTVAEAMDAEITRMKSAVESVATNYANEAEEVKAKARIALLVKFDTADVITAVAAWKKEQAEIAAHAEEERKRQAEKDAAMEEQKKALAAKRAAGGQGAPVPAAKPVASASSPASSSPAKDDPTESYKLKITGKRSALVELRKFGEGLGLTFENLEPKAKKGEQ